ncbi:MAG TPA: hypothetical protein VIK90_01445, partial [Limnochordales bacterium]
AAVVAEVLGLVRPEALAELAGHFVEGNVADGLALIGRLTTEEGIDPRLVARDLLALLRDAAAFKILGPRRGAGEAGGSEAPAAAAVAARAPLSRLVAAMESLLAAEPQMRWAPDARIALELALMRLARTEEADTSPPVRGGPEGQQAADQAGVPRQPAPAPPPSPPPSAPRPAGTTPAHRAPAAARAGSGPLLLDEVQRRWPDVLGALRSQQRRSAAKVEALLREGRPIRVEGLEITIGFPEDRAFHRNAVEGDEKARQMVEKICSRLLGRPVTIRTEIIDGESAPPPAVPAPAAAPEAAPAPQPPAQEPVAPGSKGEAPPGVPPAPAPSRTRAAADPAPRREREPGEDGEWDEATLRAVLEILEARIIREFDAEPPDGAPAASDPHAPAGGG